MPTVSRHMSIFRRCVAADDATALVAHRPPTPSKARLLARRWRRPHRAFLVGGEPGGYRPLCEAIADYLAMARAVFCRADQVIITSGAQQALDAREERDQSQREGGEERHAQPPDPPDHLAVEEARADHLPGVHRLGQPRGREILPERGQFGGYPVDFGRGVSAGLDLRPERRLDPALDGQ